MSFFFVNESGLWSVNIVSLLPSIRWAKFLTERYIANNSRSYVLYFACVGVSFWEKKPSGRHWVPTRCSNAPPTPIDEASTLRINVASEDDDGWERSTASANLSLHSWNAFLASFVHGTLTFVPLPF